jgi:regulator of sigma E protease
VVPEAAVAMENGEETRIGRIGVTSSFKTVRLAPWASLVAAAKRAVEAAGLIFAFVYRLVTGQAPIRQLGGPIFIAMVVKEQAAQGAQWLLSLVGLISINLFVVNILPLPGLDGWHFLTFLVEGIRRKPLSPRVQTVLQQVGFAVIVFLLLAIVVLDLTRIFGQ